MIKQSFQEEVYGHWMASAELFPLFNRFLNQRYGDVTYQIRRPDSLANRIQAFKYIVIGGSVVPITAFAAWMCLKQSPSVDKNSRSNIIPVSVDANIRHQFGIVRENIRLIVKTYLPGPNSDIRHQLGVFGSKET